MIEVNENYSWIAILTVTQQFKRFGNRRMRNIRLNTILQFMVIPEGPIQENYVCIQRLEPDPRVVVFEEGKGGSPSIMIRQEQEIIAYAPEEQCMCIKISGPVRNFNRNYGV